jgi:Flp pilus assembly protein TadB
MRRGTLVFLLLLIVLFAVFGGRVFGWLLVGFLLLLLLPFVVLVVGFWFVQRRIKRRLKEAGEAFAQAVADRQRAAEAPSRPDAIDVDARVLPDDDAGPRSP